MVKNGKLFGKFNIIDFLAIIVVLIAIAAVLLFIFMPRNQGDTLIIKYKIEEVDAFVASKVHVGDELYDDTYSIDLGYITDVELDDSISYGTVTDGVYTLTSKEGYYSMIITGEVQGEKTTLGAELGGKKYGVGHSFVLRAGDAKLYLRVYDIQVKDKEQDTETDPDNQNQTLSDFVISFYAPEIESFIAESIEQESIVTDTARKTTLGNVTNVLIADSQSYSETDAGIISSSKDGFNSVSVICKTQGELTENGLKIENRLYGIGDEIDIRVGNARLVVKLSSITAIE